MHALVTPLDLPVGALFAGRYAVEGLLGRGGMGTVYRARDFAIGEPIALKVLLLEEGAGAVSVMRFRREVRLARRVTHPNVARVFDLGEHEGVLFLTMELVQGVTLRKLIVDEGRLSPARGLAVIHALAEGLAAAHAVGVLHRDLKPSNVLIERGGRVVITDFGIAVGVGEENDLTVGAIGTPSYMAPEQVAGATATERTDLYQLGMVAHELLVGGLPRHGSAAAEGALLAAGVPPRAAALFARSISVDADQRPATAAFLAREIAEILAALPPGVDLRPSADPLALDRTVDATAGEDLALTTPRPSIPSGTRTREVVRSLAVLPFRVRGANADVVADVFTDEVLDQLSRTKGLRVYAAAATRSFDRDVDPRIVASGLGADLVVQGSVARDADHLQFTVRLVDGTSGVQLWSDRLTSDVSAVLAAAETIARRVADELRVEIMLRAPAADLSEEVVSAYFAARRRLHVLDPAAVVEARDGFARCIELAPDFAAAYAGHASASIRCWFLFDDADGELGRAADRSVERATAHAPEIAETHLAAASHAVQHGAYPAAVRELERALAIAPMYADAHAYLGMLQCEAGRAVEGVAHLERGLELDPTLGSAALSLARERELMGDHAACERLVDAAEQRGLYSIGPGALRFRLAFWRRDLVSIARFVDDRNQRAAGFDLLRLHGEVILGRRAPEEASEALERSISVRTNPRSVSLVFQVVAEVHALRGDVPAAIAAVTRAVSAGLVDLRWLERCPLFDELRSGHHLDPALHLVRGRAAALFR